MTTINEIERLVIEFKPLAADRSLYPVCDDSQIWLVLEQQAPDQSPVWRMLNHDVDQPYSLIQGICDKEAIQAELNERTCSGKNVSAEAYIGLWRSAMLKGAPLNHLVQLGMFLPVTYTNSTQYLLGVSEDRKADAEHVLSSPYLLARNDLLCTWQFNLDCLEACELYSKLHGFRSYREPTDELYSRTFSFLFTGKSDVPPQQQILAPLDLFSENEAAA